MVQNVSKQALWNKLHFFQEQMMGTLTSNV